MRVALTGTPGTGKTTVAERLDSDLDVIHLNDVVRERDLTTGHDEQRDSAVVDFDAVAAWLDGRDDVLFESHLAHQFDADRVVVLRCHPEQLEKRLAADGVPAESVSENAESEALDVVLTEAVEKHGVENVYEIDTTDESVEAVVSAVQAVIDGQREPAAGTVSFVNYL